jgi:parallel beta-helix repeat protein
VQKTLAIAIASTALAAGLATSLIAGPLDPPAGTIAPTYKTLAEVEPRIAINLTNTPGDNDGTPSIFKITQPGSYYLTGNISVNQVKRVIEVAANDVTIDLCGFVINGGGVALSGVRIDNSGFQGLVIRNGTIISCTSSGIYAEFTTGVTLHNLTVRQSGEGARIGNGSSITDCLFESNTGVGLRCNGGCIVENVTSAQNGSAGFSAQGWSTVRGSVFRQNAGRGVSLLNGGLVTESVSSFNTDDGFWLQNGTNITNCQASGNAQAGIYLNGDCFASNNACTTNQAGIIASNTANRIDSNHVSDNTQYGISVVTSDNMIVRNTARANGVNYNIAASEYAQIIINPGNNFSATNPWANFAY